MSRVLWGAHPSGVTGLFASAPGYDIEGLDPNSLENMALSSQWGQSANVIQAGTCAQGVSVPISAEAVGYFPYIMFHQLSGAGYIPHAIKRNAKGSNEFEHLSQWRISQGQGGGSFVIVPRAVFVPDPVTGATFTYVIFNLPVV